GEHFAFDQDAPRLFLGDDPPVGDTAAVKLIFARFLFARVLLLQNRKLPRVYRRFDLDEVAQEQPQQAAVFIERRQQRVRYPVLSLGILIEKVTQLVGPPCRYPRDRRLPEQSASSEASRVVVLRCTANRRRWRAFRDLPPRVKLISRPQEENPWRANRRPTSSSFLFREEVAHRRRQISTRSSSLSGGGRRRL